MSCTQFSILLTAINHQSWIALERILERMLRWWAWRTGLMTAIVERPNIIIIMRISNVSQYIDDRAALLLSLFCMLDWVEKFKLSLVKNIYACMSLVETMLLILVFHETFFYGFFEGKCLRLCLFGLSEWILGRLRWWCGVVLMFLGVWKERDIKFFK